MIHFKEVKVDENANKTELFDRLDYLEKDGTIPSPYPGGDFILTETQVKFLFVNTFLAKFIVENPYREHLDLNFDDKIFFHEPVNKFYDLPLIRTYAWRQLMRVSHLENLFSKSAKKQESLENETIGELTKLYSTKQMELRRTSTEFESIMSKVMECASGNYSLAFKEVVLNSNTVEHAISQLLA